MARSSRNGWLSNTFSEITVYVLEGALRLGLAALVGIFLARYLGPEGLGLLSFAVGVFSLLVPIASLGMRATLVREFSVSADWRPFLTSAGSRQLPVAAVLSVIGALLVIVARGFEPDAVIIAFALIPLPILALSDMIRALDESHRNVGRVVGSALFAAVTASGAKLLAIALGFDIWVFAALVSVEAALVAVGLLWGRVNGATLRSFRAYYSPTLASRLVSESWPLLVASIAVTVYMRIDVTMLGLLVDDAETGIYVAAARLSELWYFLPVAAAGALRPRLARLYTNGQLADYDQLTQRFLSAAFWSAVLVAALIVTTADDLIGFVYGAEFLPASSVLRIHVLAAPFVFLSTASTQWFVDRRLNRTVMVRQGTGAVVNVAMNLFLIPMYGAWGAAVASLVAYGAAGVFINAFWSSSRPIFRHQMRALIGSWR